MSILKDRTFIVDIDGATSRFAAFVEFDEAKTVADNLAAGVMVRDDAGRLGRVMFAGMKGGNLYLHVSRLLLPAELTTLPVEGLYFSGAGHDGD